MHLRGLGMHERALEKSKKSSNSVELCNSIERTMSIPLRASISGHGSIVRFMITKVEREGYSKRQDSMTDFEQVKSKRRGNRQALVKQDVQETTEVRVERALAKVKEYESCLRLAWKDYWADVVQTLLQHLANPSHALPVNIEDATTAGFKDASLQSSPQADQVNGLFDALNKIRVTASSDKPHCDSNVNQSKNETLQSKLGALPSTSGLPQQVASSSFQSRRTISTDPPRRILSLGLGKPASDRTAQHQLALLVLLAKDLNVKPESIEIFDPMWDLADVKVIQELGMTPSPHNLRGTHKLDLESAAYLLYMPHCPRPLYEAILVSNWSQLSSPSSRWMMLGNELLDYLSDAQTARDESRDGQADGMTLVKSRKSRKPRGVPRPSTPSQGGALERLAPHLTCSALPSSPGSMEHSFASLKLQTLEPEHVARVDWTTPLPTAASRVPDEAGEVISRDLPFDMYL